MRHATFLLLMFLPQFLLAQIRATTEDGRVVILSPNGIWDYADSSEIAEMPSADLQSLVPNPDCRFAKNFTDAFSGETERITEHDEFAVNTVAGDRTIWISASRLQDQYWFHLVYWGKIGCATKGISKVMMKFTDGEIYEFEHVGETDCTGRPTFTCTANEEMKRLMTVPVEFIRLIGSESQMDLDFTQHGNVFAKHLSCCRQ